MIKLINLQSQIDKIKSKERQKTILETDSLFNRMSPSIAPQTVLKKRGFPEITV